MHAAGTDEVDLELKEPADTQSLRTALEARYPGLLALLPRCAIARNGEYTQGVQSLADGDELAVLPPVSGG